MSTREAKIIRAGEGEAVWAMSEKITFKLGPEDTGGAFGVAELVSQPNGGPPPHIHRREDEMFLVLNGDFMFAQGERSFNRTNGFAVYLAKNVLHTYNNIGQR